MGTRRFFLRFYTVGPEIAWGTVGFLFISRACIWARSSLENPKYLFLQGPYSAFLGKTTTGTCSDFAFCHSEAGHYRVPMLYSTSVGFH